MKIHHINCGVLQAPGGPLAICHCLLLEGPRGLTLVDAGIGLEDGRNPAARIGQAAIDAAGFQFAEADTAVRQIERLGLRPADVADIILTHADPDHAGGLADFPHARVHLSAEELSAAGAGNPRYSPAQFAHSFRPVTYDDASTTQWLGLPARRLALPYNAAAFLVPLPGHTLGHCGVAIEQRDRWLLHAGDAYYLRAELTDDNHPVAQLAAARADDNARRVASVGKLRMLLETGLVDMLGYHDSAEWPPRIPPTWRTP